MQSWLASVLFPAQFHQIHPNPTTAVPSMDSHMDQSGLFFPVLHLLVATLDEDFQPLSAAVSHHSSACHALSCSMIQCAGQNVITSCSEDTMKTSSKDNWLFNHEKQTKEKHISPRCCDGQTPAPARCGAPLPVETSSPASEKASSEDGILMDFVGEFESTVLR